MTEPLIAPLELPFQLFDVQDTETLLQRQRFSEHSRETLDAVLDTAEKIATEHFATHNHKADQQEPTFDGQSVSMIPEVKAAFDAYCEAGFLAGRADFDAGGMQLPETIMTACSGYFMAANPSTAGYPFLTVAAANVIQTFASETLQQRFVPPMLTGRFTGTMALTEPHAGSSLADIRTRAVPAGDGTYRVKGSKLYISAGEHELSDNIVHLVLAKLPDAPSGVKGISLFVVPKFRLDAQGEPAERNDVALAGLIHKLGYRGTTSTALSFGDNDDCHGYLVGEPHQGLRYMFQMMNEARLGVGFGAAMIGYRGYRLSLAYAKDRLQGRPTGAGPDTPAVPIIEHGDVKRMLLAQKAYTEGAMALCFYAARLVDDVHSLPDSEEREQTRELLDLLTPVVKAWPSEFGVKANDLAIQVLGGAGYTREYPVEQCWRDNRLNPIHEGTNGIQALDLLGRKLWQANGAGLQVLQQRLQQDLAQMKGEVCQNLSAQVAPYLQQFAELMTTLQKDLRTSALPVHLTNAQCFMNIFSSLVVSWMWLRQAHGAERRLAQGADSEQHADFYQGKLQAAAYYIEWELPLVSRDFALLQQTNTTCHNMKTDWF
ncbi:acyl-CoA dehydrogenase [Aestuariibacter halophilus]|uniref:Acyl-CoA dehydrogenase n=1 Tax=Fluctibacter halophilus TaxID=226011 RepID=A0ABS8G6R5_9ALTE|nr:acyl-CoA dehydrogenase [Aestuariibacter halophilus]MCC2615384.1 acyl-CoA dehydrogenase [Aestuariibacter halophilus]